MTKENGEQQQKPAYPLHFSRNTAGTKTAAPKLGEHTDEIMSRMGYSLENINKMKKGVKLPQPTGDNTSNVIQDPSFRKLSTIKAPCSVKKLSG